MAQSNTTDITKQTKQIVTINKTSTNNRYILNKRKTLTGIRRVVITKPHNKNPKKRYEFSIENSKNKITKKETKKEHPKELKEIPKDTKLKENPKELKEILKDTKQKENPKTHKEISKDTNNPKELKENYKRVTKDVHVLTNRIKKSIFRPRHTLVSHGQVYNVCKTCPSYLRKRLKVLK